MLLLAAPRAAAGPPLVPGILREAATVVGIEIVVAASPDQLAGGPEPGLLASEFSAAAPNRRLLFDETFSQKPAYDAVLDSLRTSAPEGGMLSLVALATLALIRCVASAHAPR